MVRISKSTIARGAFVSTHEMGDFTSAVPFSVIGKRTPVVVRMATLVPGSPHAARGIRTVRLTFQTELGPYDVPLTSSPVFYIRDAADGQYLWDVLRGDNVERQWDFFWVRPESVRQMLWLFSDEGLPQSYRYMHGYSPVLLWTDARNRKFWVRFFLESESSAATLSDQDFETLAATDLIFHHNEMVAALSRGEEPRWTVYVQVMAPAEVEELAVLGLDAFDATKVWPRETCFLRPVGYMVLEGIVEHEVPAFDGRLIPGTGPSPDATISFRFPELTHRPLERPMNRRDRDFFSEASAHYRSMSPEETESVARRIVRSLIGVAGRSTFNQTCALFEGVCSDLVRDLHWWGRGWFPTDQMIEGTLRDLLELPDGRHISLSFSYPLNEFGDCTCTFFLGDCIFGPPLSDKTFLMHLTGISIPSHMVSHFSTAINLQRLMDGALVPPALKLQWTDASRFAYEWIQSRAEVLDRFSLNFDLATEHVALDSYQATTGGAHGD